MSSRHERRAQGDEPILYPDRAKRRMGAHAAGRDDDLHQQLADALLHRVQLEAAIPCAHPI